MYFRHQIYTSISTQSFFFKYMLDLMVFFVSLFMLSWADEMFLMQMKAERRLFKIENESDDGRKLDI